MISDVAGSRVLPNVSLFDAGSKLFPVDRSVEDRGRGPGDRRRRAATKGGFFFFFFFFFFKIFFTHTGP